MNENDSPATNTPAPVPAAPANPVPAPPPAATIVANGRTEREADLEKELAAEKASHASTAAEKKARELRIAELENELHERKQRLAAMEEADRQRVPAKKSSGWFFEEGN